VQVGPDKTVDVAERAGLSENCTDKEMKAGDTGGCSIGLTPNPSNVLGTPSVKPIDMASAYATFAANGVHHETHSIKKVTKGAEDEEVYKAETKGKRVFDKAVGAETSYALSQVVQGGSGSYAQNLGRPAAGKTGTTNENKAAWFSGYTPNLATSVVLYREVDGKSVSIGAYGGRSEVTGGSFPIQVWTDYMKTALQGEKVEQFPARGELPDKPKPKNTNPAPAPKPEPKEEPEPEAPADNSDGDEDKETEAPIETPKDEKDKDSKGDEKGKEEGSEDGSDKGSKDGSDGKDSKDGGSDGGGDNGDGGDKGGGDNGNSKRQRTRRRWRYRRRRH
jgi:membrane peptidoglycan carboxypeptidase